MCTLKAEVIRKLPPLAWGAQISRRGTVSLVCGSSVYATKEGFTEGAWSDDFSIEGFRRAKAVVGSGGYIVGDSVVFRSSTHTLERMWFVPTQELVFASNSLPLVLALSGTFLDDSYPHYEADFLSFILGTKMRRSLKLAGGKKLLQFADSTVKVKSSLKVEAAENRYAPVFSCFEEYLETLESLSIAITKNASASSRARNYTPLASVSRGYDSPACATIARRCGASRAITFPDARAGFMLSNDNGSDVGYMLGLDVIVLDRTAYRSGNGDYEALFLASGGGGEDVVLSAADEILPGSIFFTGFLGDTLWGVQTDWRRSHRGRITYPGGGSIGEYRLNRDFVHLPLPILHLKSHRSVQRISCSEAMKPWRLGIEYDRPIPRRIAEEAGVRRDAFGIQKMAVTVPMYYETPITQVLGKAAEESFKEFAKEKFPLLDIPKMRRRLRLYAATNWIRERITWRISKMLYVRGLLSAIEPSLADRGRRSISESLLLVHWAVERLRGRYSDAILANLAR